jgi:hypothetical protein
MEVFDLCDMCEGLPRVLGRVVSKVLPSHHPSTPSPLGFKSPPPLCNGAEGSVKNIRSKVSKKTENSKVIKS